MMILYMKRLERKKLQDEINQQRQVVEKFKNYVKQQHKAQRQEFVRVNYSVNFSELNN